MSTASWIQPPCRYYSPDRRGGGFAKPSCSRARQFPGVVSSSSCSCGYSEILNFDFGNGFFLYYWWILILGIDLEIKRCRLVLESLDYVILKTQILYFSTNSKRTKEAPKMFNDCEKKSQENSYILSALLNLRLYSSFV